MPDTKGSYLGALTKDCSGTYHQVLLDECLFAPLLNTGMNLKRFIVGGRSAELGVDLQQGRSNDARGFNQLTPGFYATLHEEIQRGCVHPPGEIREKNNAGRITVTEHHLNFINE